MTTLYQLKKIQAQRESFMFDLQDFMVDLATEKTETLDADTSGMYRTEYTTDDDTTLVCYLYIDGGCRGSYDEPEELPSCELQYATINGYSVGEFLCQTMVSFIEDDVMREVEDNFNEPAY